MNALSWICRQVWGYTVLAAIAAGWFYGWKVGLLAGLAAYGVVMLALWEKPKPVRLTVKPTHRRDYSATRTAAENAEIAANEAAATATFDRFWAELFPKD